MARKRRAKTRRQAQIRRKQQLQREAAERRATEPDRPLRSEQRRAHRATHKGKSQDSTRGLTWRFGLSLIVLLYGLGIWAVRFSSPSTVENHPTLWIGLLVVLACGVGACLGAGLSVTVRRRQWRWVIPMAIPVIDRPDALRLLLLHPPGLPQGPRRQIRATRQARQDDRVDALQRQF